MERVTSVELWWPVDVHESESTSPAKVETCAEQDAAVAADHQRPPAGRGDRVQSAPQTTGVGDESVLVAHPRRARDLVVDVPTG
jgi:hypothetical protein